MRMPFTFTGLVVLFLACTSLSAWSAPQHALDAPVNEVVVYRDQAQVQRSGSVKLAAGLNEVSISGLPRQLRDESLQVTGHGMAVTLLDTQIETGIDGGELPSELKALHDQLDTLEQQRDQQQDTLAALKQRQQFLDRIAAAATHPPAEGNSLPSLQGWRDYLQFLGKEWEALNRQQRRETDTLQDINQQIKAVKASIDRYQTERRQPAKTAHIRLHAEQAGELEIRLSYQVRGASWAPLYDAQISDQANRVTLRYRALVRQRTGEPWDNAKLVLSTASPSSRGNAPELPVWHLRPYEPPVAVRTREMEDRAGAMKLASAPMAEAVAMSPAAAQVESGLTAARFVIRNPVSVAADNSPQAVTIAELSLEGEFTYTLVPSLSNHAYLEVESDYTGDAPLLPGMINVFLNHTLVGQSLMPLTQPGESLTLPMGINEAITSEHRQLKRFVETSGLINKTRKVSFEYQTDIANQSGQTAQFVVKERIPVSQDERIKVTLQKPGADHKVEDHPGEIHWTFTLKPGEKRSLSLRYSVDHPEDMRVPGV